MKNTKKITLSALFLALGLVMPFLTMQIPEIGSMMLPMHIPVLVCGFVCGWKYGLLVGFVTPVLRSMVFGIPYMMPTAAAMAFELATYGAVAGLLYDVCKRTKTGTYLSLFVAMICGRVVWGIVSVGIYSAMGMAFSWELFVGGALLEAVPGIVLQLVVVPPFVILLKKRDFI